MGILGKVASGMMGNQTMGGSGNPMMGMLMGLLNQHGGLSGLTGRFRQQGMGNLVDSWVGTGENLPVAPDQVHQALGDETIQGISSQTGMAPHLVTQQLSRFLPEMVNRLTPNGHVPQEPVSEQHLASSGIGDMLSGIFGRAA